MAAAAEGPAVLESGDRLTCEEFHRRYCTRPDITKAELVMGVVYVASPLNSERHGEPDHLAGVWLGVFAGKTPGLRVTNNATVFLKMEAYRRAGVPEYIVWRVLDQRIDWFRLRDGSRAPPRSSCASSRTGCWHSDGDDR